MTRFESLVSEEVTETKKVKDSTFYQFESLVSEEVTETVCNFIVTSDSLRAL